MSEEPDSDDGIDESRIDGVRATAATNANYKVLGEFADGDGAGVLGRNTAASGNPVGVYGEAPNVPGGLGLYTPDSAQVRGDLLVNQRVFTPGIDSGGIDLRIDTGDTVGFANNLVAGHGSNAATSGVVGGVVGGGGYDDGSSVDPNEVADDYGTVSGGRNNVAGDGVSTATTAAYATVGGGRDNTAAGTYATVGGGWQNVADADYATIGGGGASQVDNATGTNNAVYDDFGTVSGGGNNQAGSADATSNNVYATVGGGRKNVVKASYGTAGGGRTNTVTGDYATVPGGRDNTAQKLYSFAAGRGATAQHEGAIVYGDSTTSTISSNNIDEFRIQHDFYAASVTEYSAAAAKTDVDPVDPESVLEGVEELDVSRWTYEWDDEKRADPPRHLGPMAGDFHEQFGVGNDPEHITNVDANGVAFAAIQGLSERLADRDERVDELEAEAEHLREQLAEREARVDELEARLSALERQVESAPESAPADD